MIGNKVRVEQTQLYYEAIIESTTASMLATTTLSTRTYFGEKDGQKPFPFKEMFTEMGREVPDYVDNLHGYEAARTACAKTVRRMLGAGERCPPAGLFAEIDWDLPDKIIIQAKLGLADRLRARQKKNRDEGKEEDYIDRMTRISVREVRGGWREGLHAEVRRLWEEADMLEEWDQEPGKVAGEKRKGTRKEAATRISQARHSKWLKERSETDYDGDYWSLYDGTNWRITNGNKEEVGLMVTARLGALILTDSRAAAAWGGDPTCVLCRSGNEDAKHMMLECTATSKFREELIQALHQILTHEQLDEYYKATQHEQRMTLLGKQMEAELSMAQQKALDTATKSYLLNVNRMRQEVFDMPSMTAAALPTSLEMTMRMSEQLEQEEMEERERRMQGGDPSAAMWRLEDLAEEWEREEDEAKEEELEDE
jgi:hypothetical protein